MYRLDFSGMIKRVSNTTLDVIVVTPPVTDQSKLAALWKLLKDWQVPRDDVASGFELCNHTDSFFLRSKFQILHPDGEQDGWSAKEADSFENDDAFTVVSSLK